MSLTQNIGKLPEGGWKSFLTQEMGKEYFQKLIAFLENEEKSFQIFPKQEEIFSAFLHTPFEEVKIVILGQDPYHGPEQAHGLSFSVPLGIAPPPSLKNIFKEINRDLIIPISPTGNLIPWAQQGVLLLNSILTVRANYAGSHQKKGWETFTDSVISKISKEKENVVFMLWGNYAKSKKILINSAKHFILEAGHPSPLSVRHFTNCSHFSKANSYLKEKGLKEIQWSLSY